MSVNQIITVKKKEFAPLVLLIVSVVLMAISVMLKSMLVIAGVTGLVVAWFLCIDRLIASSKLSLAARLVFAGAVVGLPVFVTVAMS